MKKILLTSLLTLGLWRAKPEPAQAFIFSDVAALAQRAAHLIQHMAQWKAYIESFHLYYDQFLEYYGTFRGVYQRMHRSQWVRWLTTDWGNYRDFLNFGEMARLAYSMESGPRLRVNRLYAQSAAYRDYADSLIDDYVTDRDKQLTRELLVRRVAETQQARIDKIAEYESVNHGLSVWEGPEPSVAQMPQQLSLLCSLLIELLKQNDELSAMTRLRMEKEMDDYRRSLEALGRRSDANQQRTLNAEVIRRGVTNQ